MSLRLSARLAVGLPTLALWALVAGSAALWWLRADQVSAPLRLPVVAGATAAPAVDGAVVARALGAAGAAPAAAPAAPELAGRLALRGVLTHGGRGAALIAIDGKPARPVRVGAVLEGVDGGWRLHSVAPHAAVLAAAGGRELRLEMPPLNQRSGSGSGAGPAQPAPLARSVRPTMPALPGIPLAPSPQATVSPQAPEQD